MRHQTLKVRLHIRSVVLLTLFALVLSALPAFAAAEGRRTININTANATQLALLPRVGPTAAQRILDFRKQNGPFKATEDLMHVKGIGEKTFALLKPYVAVAGESTLSEKVHSKRAKAEGSTH